MINSFDEFDHEAAREGSAISRLKGYAIERNERKQGKGDTKKGKPEKDVDILRILNIIKGKR